jgi:hypothetical protein
MAANVRSRKGRIAAHHRGSKPDVRRNVLNARFTDVELALLQAIAGHLGWPVARFVAFAAVDEAKRQFGHIEYDAETDTYHRVGGVL